MIVIWEHGKLLLLKSPTTMNTGARYVVSSLFRVQGRSLRLFLVLAWGGMYIAVAIISENTWTVKMGEI